MTTIIYPIASSWVIGEGWLYNLGFHDAGGAGYIHMLGGSAGFIGTLLLGPRSSIFDKTSVNKLVKVANMKKSKKYQSRLKIGNNNLYKSMDSDSNSSTMSSFMAEQVRFNNLLQKRSGA